MKLTQEESERLQEQADFQREMIKDQKSEEQNIKNYILGIDYGRKRGDYTCKTKKRSVKNMYPTEKECDERLKILNEMYENLLKENAKLVHKIKLIEKEEKLIKSMRDLQREFRTTTKQ